MARGKFNKRGGGPRLAAENADEIEIRNTQLAELQERRQARRDAEDDSDEDQDEKKDKEQTKGGDTQKATATDSSKKQLHKKPDAKPAAPVTTEADHKRNLAKLEQVRKRREEAQARRALELEEEVRIEEERKQLAAATLEDNKSSTKKSTKTKTLPKLDKISIKKMKPAQLKEHLKERGCDIQGSAKVLQARLLKYEQER